MRSLNMLLILVVLVGCGVVNVFPLAWGQDTDSDFTPPPGEPLKWISIVIKTTFWGLTSFVIIYIIYRIIFKRKKTDNRDERDEWINLKVRGLRAISFLEFFARLNIAGSVFAGIVFLVILAQPLSSGNGLGAIIIIMAQAPITSSLLLVISFMARNLVAIRENTSQKGDEAAN